MPISTPLRTTERPGHRNRFLAVCMVIVEAPRLGWLDPEIVASLLGGAALFAGFLLREQLARDPMLPLAIFRRPNFAAANIETFAVYAALSVFFFFLTLYLQQVAGFSPLHSGLVLVPATVTAASRCAT